MRTDSRRLIRARIAAGLFVSLAVCGLSPAQSFAVGDADAFWAYADVLYWQIDGADVPPLVTASAGNVPLNLAGRLGLPSTAVIAGGDEINDQWRYGYRIGGGFWLDRCNGCAVIGDYFNAGRDDDGFSRGPLTGAIIGRPFFNTQTGLPDVELVDVPNQLGGRVDIRSSTDFQGAGVAGMLACCDCFDCCGNGSSLAFFSGYRYYKHDSVLSIEEDLVVLPGTTAPLVPGTQILLQDRFSARNEFHGGEIGAEGRIQRSDFFVEGLAAVAIGGNRRTVFVDGSTTTTVPGAGSAVSSGGLLTSEVTNIGRYSDTDTVVIPRFRLGVGAQLTQHIALRTGYNVIIWDDVVEAASHLPPNLAVDPRNLPPVQPGGGADPAFPGLIGHCVVAHGLDAGVEVTW